MGKKHKPVWQYPHTMPTDGQVVLALLDESDVPIAVRYDKDVRKWVVSWDGDPLTDSDVIRYWMPIPADPDA